MSGSGSSFSSRAATADAGELDREVVIVSGDAVFNRTGLAFMD